MIEIVRDQLHCDPASRDNMSTWACPSAWPRHEMFGLRIGFVRHFPKIAQAQRWSRHPQQSAQYALRHRFAPCFTHCEAFSVK